MRIRLYCLTALVFGLSLLARTADAECAYCARVLGATVPWCNAQDYGTPGGSRDCHQITSITICCPVAIAVSCIEEGNKCEPLVGPPEPPPEGGGGGDGGQWYGRGGGGFEEDPCSFVDASGECWG
jgi:hypothetical protein